MKKLKLKRIISSFLVAVMMLSTSLTAFAATNTTSSDIADVESTQSVMTREEALEILGITEEEAEGLTLYEFNESNPNGRAIPSTINDGVYYEDMSITGGFTGAAHPCNGNRFKWAVRVDSKGSGQLAIGLFSYDKSLVPAGGSWFENMYAGNTYQSDWRTIYSGATMYFQYVYSYYSGTPANFRLVVAVANV